MARLYLRTVAFSCCWYLAAIFTFGHLGPRSCDALWMYCTSGLCYGGRCGCICSLVDGETHITGHQDSLSLYVYSDTVESSSTLIRWTLMVGEWTDLVTCEATMPLAAAAGLSEEERSFYDHLSMMIFCTLWKTIIDTAIAQQEWGIHFHTTLEFCYFFFQ